MTKREFLDIVFDLAPTEANKIMDAFDEYVNSNEPHWIPVTEEPMNDLISRQAAIDALDQIFDRCEEIEAHLPEGDPDRTGYKMYPDYMTVWKYLHQLPTAQPEIIRCTECKHYREYDSEYVANAVVVQCMADRYPISETIPDGWFCAGAERKDDE